MARRRARPATLTLLRGRAALTVAPALCAISHQPAPICCDEVDAPLDDAKSSVRDLLDRMTQETDTRDLIVTNKGDDEPHAPPYGVTMSARASPRYR